jgi:multidrug efflux system outer membrane protein
LLERRPDIKAAEDVLVAANANIGAAKALFFPNFSLTSTLGSATHDLSNLADKRAAGAMLSSLSSMVSAGRASAGAKSLTSCKHMP